MAGRAVRQERRSVSPDKPGRLLAAFCAAMWPVVWLVSLTLPREMRRTAGRN